MLTARTPFIMSLYGPRICQGQPARERVTSTNKGTIWSKRLKMSRAPAMMLACRGRRPPGEGLRATMPARRHRPGRQRTSPAAATRNTPAPIAHTHQHQAPPAHSPTPTPTPPLAAPTHTNHTPQTPIELVDTKHAPPHARVIHADAPADAHPHQRHRTHPDQSSSPAEKHKSPRACGIPTRYSVRRVFCQSA